MKDRMTKDGFPDRANSSSHILRQRVRSVLTCEWQGIDDIQEAVKERWPEEGMPTKWEIGRSLKTLAQWGMIQSQNGAARSRTSITVKNEPRKVRGWKKWTENDKT